MNEPVQPQPVPPRSNTDTLVMLGFIFAALGLFCCCCNPIFTIPALILGIIAYSRGDQRGLWVIIAAVAVMALSGGLGIWAKPQRYWAPYIPREIPGPWRGT